MNAKEPPTGPSRATRRGSSSPRGRRLKLAAVGADNRGIIRESGVLNILMWVVSYWAFRTWLHYERGQRASAPTSISDATERDVTDGGGATPATHLKVGMCKAEQLTVFCHGVNKRQV